VIENKRCGRWLPGELVDFGQPGHVLIRPPTRIVCKIGFVLVLSPFADLSDVLSDEFLAFIKIEFGHSLPGQRPFILLTPTFTIHDVNEN